MRIGINIFRDRDDSMRRARMKTITYTYSVSNRKSYYLLIFGTSTKYNGYELVTVFINNSQ